MTYEQSNLVTNYATYRGNTIQICLDEIYQLLKCIFICLNIKLSSTINSSSYIK